MSAAGSVSFVSSTVSRDEVVNMISRGDYMIISGDERVLASLPSGNWIAGTIPYFMTEEGGKVDQDSLFVNTISGLPSNNLPRLTLYDANTISRIAEEAPEHGFTFLILPAGSDVHLSYAQNAPDFPKMFFSPIIGWIAGVHLDELASRSAKVGFGPAGGLLSDTQAAAIHVPLPDSQVAQIKTINLFNPGEGAAIQFPENGFSVGSCKVDGADWRLSDYIKEHNIDTRLPLVANYSGMMVNVSIQEVGDGEVNLYAPVFPGVEYRFASPVSDYVTEFNQALPASDSKTIAFSCNCILNFLYSELEGKKIGQLTGPVTFGEVAYQLLNQTLVYLTLEDI
ncbi:DUF6976 family protein [Teredinibacter franksiae]|uniref:DUF6976 family protein n=1 Tax=Teredinibacter franksiae TaxID=2761453 RepID=UPI001624AF81|nr:hypothetical protein [Teredinibacter franksiae]